MRYIGELCPQEYEKKIEELKVTAVELRKEIGIRHLETKNLKEDLNTKNHNMQTAADELEEKVVELEHIKVCESGKSIYRNK